MARSSEHQSYNSATSTQHNSLLPVVTLNASACSRSNPKEHGAKAIHVANTVCQQLYGGATDARQLPEEQDAKTLEKKAVCRSRCSRRLLYIRMIDAALDCQGLQFKFCQVCCCACEFPPTPGKPAHWFASTLCERMQTLMRSCCFAWSQATRLQLESQHTRYL